jgi:hypothetical protein
MTKFGLEIFSNGCEIGQNLPHKTWRFMRALWINGLIRGDEIHEKLFYELLDLFRDSIWPWYGLEISFILCATEHAKVRKKAMRLLFYEATFDKRFEKRKRVLKEVNIGSTRPGSGLNRAFDPALKDVSSGHISHITCHPLSHHFALALGRLSVV